MTLIGLLFLAGLWDGMPTWLTKNDILAEDLKWLIETTLATGVSLFIGGLIAEQLASKKDE